GFCREGGPVAQVRWTEWLAPTATAPWDGDVHQPAASETGAERAYQALLSEAARTSSGHEVLVTVTVDQRRLRSGQSRRSDRLSAAVDVLVEELRLLDGRLAAAGLAADPPLSAA